MAANRIVDGFLFYTDKDAVLAAQEQKKVEYMENKMNYDNPTSVLHIYNRAIQERIFKSPIGIMYLKYVQQFLNQCEEINQEEILPISLYITFDGEIREHTNPAKQRVQPAKKKKSSILPISIILNMALIAAVIAMFVITLNANQPNILNYEKNLVNQYSEWAQELTEREQAVREKEMELKIQQ